MCISHHQNAGQNDHVMIANKAFQNMIQSNIWERLQQIKTGFRKKLR